MSAPRPQDVHERLADLCSDYAMGQIDEQGLRELDRLDPDHSVRNAFEAAAAQLDAALAMANPVDAPEGLLDTLMSGLPQQSDAGVHAQGGPDIPAIPREPSPVAGRIAWLPWTLAAASLALAAIVLLSRAPAPRTPTLARQRDELIRSADPNTLIRYAWTPTQDPAVVGEVRGELVWDDQQQRGYMTISGLEVNDPSRFQYQLWIFDATRPKGDLPQFAGPFDGLLTQRPVDGGVFDITDSGEVIIPIDAKLPVGKAAAFAVTVEPPGGVVVSDRSRVPLLALHTQG